MSVPTVEGWLTVPEAASESRLSERTLRREIKDSRLIACRVGRCVRIRRADLDAWMESRRVVAA